jgi:hypothetical protein
MAGVDKGYITESMGHSQNQSITDRYIANYPLAKQMEYNNKLLDLEPKVTVDDIKSMTDEQKTAMLLQLLNKR